MKPALLFSCLLVTACSAAPASRSGSATAPAMVAASDPFPVPKSGLTIPGDASKSLLDLVTEFERVTGVHVVVMPDIRANLSKISSGLTQPLEVPAARVYSTVENLLAENTFMLTLLQAEPPIMVGLVTVGGPPSRDGRPLFATPVDLEIASRHPALLTSVVLTLPHVSVRDLSNSLRQLMQNPTLQQIIPIGNSDSLLLSGRGSEVTAMARMLLALEESEARRQAEDAKRAGPSGSGSQSGSVKKDEAPPK